MSTPSNGSAGERRSTGRNSGSGSSNANRSAKGRERNRPATRSHTDRKSVV